MNVFNNLFAFYTTMKILEFVELRIIDMMNMANILYF